MTSRSSLFPGASALLRQVLPIEDLEPITIVANRSWEGRRRIRGNGCTVSAFDLDDPGPLVLQPTVSPKPRGFLLSLRPRAAAR